MTLALSIGCVFAGVDSTNKENNVQQHARHLLLGALALTSQRAEPPGVSAGGTYGQVLPNSIPFGMWFPGKPYPGHDVDEHISLADLHRG
jgi:acetylornithine deacetylase/succinyl-diaminopimelate desuccinylase-like protein